MIEGGCFCAKVRYRIDAGAYPSLACHCTMCRRVHAAPWVAWIVVGRDQFHHVGEAPARLASSPTGTRSFCAACGTHLACVHDEHPEIVAVAVGSLDDPEAFPPERAVFADTRLGWVGA